MDRFQLNSLLLVENKTKQNKPILYFDTPPLSAKHHSQLIEESFQKKMWLEPNTMIVCLEVKQDVYGTNLKFLEPSSGTVGWVISGYLRSL